LSVVAILAGMPYRCELQHRWCATSVSKSFCPLYVVMIEIFEAEMPCAPPEGRKQRGRRVVG
jgi:hypothetical protein